NTMAYSLNKNILSTQFTKSLFETINLPSFIQVGALPSYNTNDIESIKVKIPKIDEQEKIGILLKKIERLITRQQSKIKKLQSTKQFLLQNMFI
ncbi:type I restriction-modification system, specificity subunit S, partial [Lactobacillus crispatus]